MVTKRAADVARWQKEYRARRSALLARAAEMETQLTLIDKRLESSDKPLAMEIRAMARKGLGL